MYTEDDVFTLARRRHNTKRSYLLINPLQAKHIPVSPSAAVGMMCCLGDKIAEKVPGASLVIGFAETATSVAAFAAGRLGSGCGYIHTTREFLTAGGDRIGFLEEHSHAAEHELHCGFIEERAAGAPAVVFVDDEISTGKTLINAVTRLRERFPVLREKPTVAASLISRLSPRDEETLSAAGIESISLVRMPWEDLTGAAERFEISDPEDCTGDGISPSAEAIAAPAPFPDPRLGVEIGEYLRFCRDEAAFLAPGLKQMADPAGKILVLGTEECMLPALILGLELEKSGAAVRCHATTRSPIGICGDPGYPITSGYRLRSMYDSRRTSYIYDLAPYALAAVVTDAPRGNAAGRADLRRALEKAGCRRIVFIEGGRDVQHV